MNIFVPKDKVQRDDEGIEGPHNVHAEGSGICGTETLCGHVDTPYASKWKATNKVVTCAGCLDVIRMAKLARVGGAQ